MFYAFFIFFLFLLLKQGD